MSTRTIYYSSKSTLAGTIYVDLSEADQNFVLTKLIQCQSYMNELSVAKEKDIQRLVKFWNKFESRLPKHKYLGSRNSPCSFIAGCINNLLYGTQYNFSLAQIEAIQRIFNTFGEIKIAVERDLNKTIQNAPWEGIEFRTRGHFAQTLDALKTND